MKNFVLGVVLGALLLGSAMLLGLRLGYIDFSADTPHSPFVFNLIDESREQFVANASASITPPSDLSSQARIVRGAGNYAAMCAQCHLAPGQQNTESSLGLYPQPPNLMEGEGHESTPEHMAMHFWTIKHGIKGSAMPAWSKAGLSDDDAWNLVAFLSKAPTLSKTQYDALVESSDGHHHQH